MSAKTKQTLLTLGVVCAAIGFLATTLASSFVLDPEIDEMVWVVPRDLAYQWSTALGGILLAAAVAFFLPLDWLRPETERERITSQVCLTALWCMIIYALARH